MYNKGDVVKLLSNPLGYGTDQQFIVGNLYKVSIVEETRVVLANMKSDTYIPFWVPVRDIKLVKKFNKHQVKIWNSPGDEHV
jgi:hypothetical protein